MNVTAARESERQKHIAGPGDLSALGPGSVVVVRGEVNRERDFGFWAPALGAAVLRGASVRRLP